MIQKKQLPTGQNVYQARIYSISDELVFKHTFTDFQQASDFIMEQFADEHDGPLFSRGSVRCLDSVRRDWLVPHAVSNPRALLFSQNQSVVEEWKITIYDIGDEIMESRCSVNPFTNQNIAAELQSKNGFYCVISAREMMGARFLIERIELNRCFNLTVLGPDGLPAKPYVLKRGERLELAYFKALARDRAETQRIQKARNSMQ